MLETDADRLAILQALGDQDSLVNGQATWGVFDSAYADLDGVAGLQPRLQCRSSDVVGVTNATAVARAGLSYRVAGIEPDGTGMTLLVLERIG